MGPASAEYHSRLDSDPRVDATAVVLACAFNLLLVFLLIPADMRHESRERTAMRFAYPGPTRYEEIRVHLLPAGNPDAGGPRRMMGRIEPENEAKFRGKVKEVAEVPPRAPRGDAGTSELPSTGIDAMERLRLLHGNLPTALTEEIATRYAVRPEYPEEARAKGIEGLVILVAFVDEEGLVEDVAVEQAVDPLLDQAAIRAAYRTPFVPYRIDGVAQAVFVRMPYRFELVGRLVE